jgi:hypothetical protein
MKRGFLFLIGLTLIGFLYGCSAPEFSGALIEYHRIGGFAGFNDRLVIETNGKAVLTRKTDRVEFILPQVTLDRLIAAFGKAEFNKLGREYLPVRKGNDLIEYTLIYKGQTVHTMDTAVPEVLQPVLEILNQIIASGGKS